MMWKPWMSYTFKFYFLLDFVMFVELFSSIEYWLLFCLYRCEEVDWKEVQWLDGSEWREALAFQGHCWTRRQAHDCG